MKTSIAGMHKLEQREGRRLTSYQDTEGNWTIGIGMTTFEGRPVYRAMTITAAQCDAEFERQLASYEASVSHAVAPRLLTQNQFDACVSLCWNIGKGGFGSSTVARKLRTGDVEGAADAFMLWVRPAVLRGRRLDEMAQFRTPDAELSPSPAIVVSGDTSTRIPITTFAPPHILPAPAAQPSFWARTWAGFRSLFA